MEFGGLGLFSRHVWVGCVMAACLSFPFGRKSAAKKLVHVKQGVRYVILIVLLQETYLSAMLVLFYTREHLLSASDTFEQESPRRHHT